MKRQTPETAIKHTIRDYLTVMKWFCFPILQGIGSKRGIADLIAVKGGVVLFIEVKAKGKQSPYQIEFESNIKSHGGHYFVARSWEDVSHYIRGL